MPQQMPAAVVTQFGQPLELREWDVDDGILAHPTRLRADGGDVPSRVVFGFAVGRA